MTKENFKDYGLHAKLLKAIELLNYEVPSKVQREVIPIALQGKDMVVKSQTGSGKTAAFGDPGFIKDFKGVLDDLLLPPEN